MKAFELLSDRSKWTQGAMARDANGVFCNELSDDAQSFCMMGAIVRCHRGDWKHVSGHVRNVMQRVVGNRSFTKTNDTLGYEAVMQVLREANV